MLNNYSAMLNNYSVMLNNYSGRFCSIKIDFYFIF